MFARLFLLFTLWPIIELAMLLYVADSIGGWNTFAIVIGTGLLGAWLVRREGWRAWERIQRDLRAGRMPADAMTDGLMVFAGGILLITPGVLSDLLGVCLIFPPTRAVLRYLFLRRWQVRGASAFRGSSRPFDGQQIQHDQIIDVRVIDHRNDETAGGA
jgi:UPF0716 protein FxsA